MALLCPSVPTCRKAARTASCASTETSDGVIDVGPGRRSTRAWPPPSDRRNVTTAWGNSAVAIAARYIGGRAAVPAPGAHWPDALTRTVTRAGLVSWALTELSTPQNRVARPT